jgi:acyl-CoA synthetase (AMP-forming)/AMP-acid ligase II
VAQSLQAALFGRLEQNPGRPALGFMGAHKGVSWLTGGELLDRAHSHAAYLAEQGLEPGDVCILVLPSGEPCSLLLLGALLRGAVPLLMAPPMLQGLSARLPEVLARVIRQTQARLVICPPSLAGPQEGLRQAKGSPRFLTGVDALVGTRARSVPPASPGPGEVAALQLTSGTTGFPRICVWKHKHVLATLDGMASAMKLTDQDVCFNWTPLYHDMGLVNNFLLCLTRGVPLVLLSPNDFIKSPALWLRGLSDTGATVTWSPNFGFAVATQRVKDEELEGARLDRVRAFWNAAERIHIATMCQFYQRFGSIGLRLEALKTNYGCAENVGGATFSDPDGMFLYERVDRHLLARRGIARKVAEDTDPHAVISVVGVGRPAPGMRAHIVSRTGRPLPDGRVGEIALETPSRMEGYLGQARATARAVRGKLLHTGDLGYLRGEELFWVGRARERITVRGRKLDPSDFEPILARIDGLRHGCFAAFGVDDEERGTQRVVLISEVRDGTDRRPKQLSNDVREQVFLHLALDLGEVILVPAGTLPKTSSGKRRHRHVRQLYLDGKIQASALGEQAPSGKATPANMRSAPRKRPRKEGACQ